MSALGRALLGMSCAAAVVVAGGALPAAAAPQHARSSGGVSIDASVPRAIKSAAIASATSVAAATGESVVIAEMNTPTEQTSAMPDGTMQLEVSSVPVRVEQGGDWVAVDTGLVPVGGWFEPSASAAPVRFSDGGTDELAQVQTESGEWITERWPYGDLPAPSIDGDTATYVEILPGVDLKMVATRTGAASIYVVKNEAAAESDKLDDLHVIIEGADLTRKSTGAVEAEADDGSTIVAGQPLWWDSSDGGTYREPGGEDPLLPVTHAVENDRMLLDVGDSVSTEKDDSSETVEYPIFVDPDWSSGIASSWYTDAAYANQSYLSAGASNVLRVGIYGDFRSDMFFQFPISALKGKVVSAARLNTQQLSVESSGAGAIQVHTYGVKPAGFTWAQEQAWNAAGTGGWSAPLQAPWYGPGYGSAPMTVGWNVTPGVKAKLGASTIQFAFTYTSPTLPSRRHYSRAATLIVTYNTPPNTPTAPAFTSPSRACGTEAAPAMIGQTNVAVSVNQTDPDGGNVGTNFHLAKASNLGANVQLLGSGLAAGGTKTVTFTDLVDGETYAWRGRGQDPAPLHSASFSAWCYFTVDTTGPALPAIEIAPGPYTVGVSTAVTMETVPSDGAAFIAYTVAAGPTSEGFVFDGLTDLRCGARLGSVDIVCPDSTGKATVHVAPVAATSTIWAVAYDRAGNPSAAPDEPPLDSGAHGTGIAVQAANSPAVSAASGHVWRTLPQASPLGVSIPDTNNATPAPLTLGRDTVRTAVGNPQNPSVPLSKPVLSFADPATTGLTGPDFTSTSPSTFTLAESFTLAAWISPGSAGGATAVSLGTAQGIPTASLGALSDKWQFCLRELNSAIPKCLTVNRSTTAGWTHLAGVVDMANEQVRLYANGTLAGSWPLPDFYVVGNTVTVDVGVVRSSAVVSGRWNGQVADLALFTGVATASQIAALRAGQDPADG